MYHYVYILKSIKAGEIYIGATSDLRARYIMHNRGKIRSTKRYLPWKLIYYEAHPSKQSAFSREGYLKTGWGRRYINTILKKTESKSLGR